MSSKTDIQVVIGGKVYTLSGYESDEYLQKIALYINNKIDEMNQIPNYRRMGMDMQKILLELNMADDYHKAKEQIHVLEADIEEKDKNEYDLKHELIAAQIHLEETEKEIENLKNEINELPYIMEKAHTKGMKVILNPSPMDEKIQALPLEQVDYFLLNEVEAGQILGTKETDGETLADRLLERFPRAAVVLTLGSKGSIYADHERRISQKAYRVKAVDTTAAGDTFTGYFIAEMASGQTPGKAMDLAAKASAIAVTRAGAAPSIPLRREVEEYRLEE